MHEIYLRFKVAGSDETFEAVLDDRLSFSENFKLLENIKEINIDEICVYDPNKAIFLNSTEPIKKFNIKGFKIYYLFNAGTNL